MVSSYKQSTSYANRTAAVEAARSLSSGIRGEVIVESQDREETLVYVLGQMVGYRFRAR